MRRPHAADTTTIPNSFLLLPSYYEDKNQDIGFLASFRAEVWPCDPDQFNELKSAGASHRHNTKELHPLLNKGKA